MKKSKKRGKLFLGIIFLFILLFGFLIYRTGFLQQSKIDERDLGRWNYSEGLIENAEEFVLEGDNETCWMLIHSYASTPDEMRELAEKINFEFGDYVYALRLQGHGKVPSKLLNLSLEDWYNQVEIEFENLNSKCGRINLVGSSFGGALAIKLAENKNFNNLYLVNAYISPTYKWYIIFSPNFYLDLFGDVLKYSKKRKLAQINSPEGLKKHIAYWNFVFAPVKNSKNFLFEMKKDFYKIDENLLVQHSVNDKVASSKEIQNFFEKSSSEVKEIVWVEKSNHVLLRDYDKERVIENIIEFEKRNRG